MNAQRITNRPGSASAGFTLIELMVALALGLFLVLVVTSLYLSTATTSRTSLLTAQMNEDATLALELIQEQLRIAGFSNHAADGKRHFSGLPLLACDGGFTSATETGPFEALACAPGGNGADAIVVRFEATTLNTPAVQSGLPPQTRASNCVSAGILPADLGSGTMVAIADNRFYLAPDVANGNTPTLFCRGANGPGTFSQAAGLIPNIEDLQLSFAITQQPVTGEVIPHQVTAHVTASDPVLAAPLAWARVAAVHVCVLARTARPLPTGDNLSSHFTRYVDCNGAVRNAADGRARRAFHTTVHLRNTRPALPAPYDNSSGVAANPFQYLHDTP